MHKTQFLKLILALLVSCLFCYNVSASTAPMPYHQQINVVVESVEYTDKKLSHIVLRWIENPDVTDRLIKLELNDLVSFLKYRPIKKGQAFLVLMSILTDPDGKQVVSYDVVRRLDINTQG